jgi:hypothetical protein
MANKRSDRSMNSQPTDNDLDREDFQGDAGYMKYKTRARAMLAARKLGGEGAHAHGDGTDRIFMPGGQPGSIGDKLKENDLPKPDHSAVMKEDSGMGGGMGDRSGGLIGDGIADRLNSLYADSDGGDADTKMRDSGMGGGFAEFADLRPRGDADPVDTRTETDDDLLNSQFGGAPSPMERDPDSGRVGPDPFAIGNFGEFNSPYSTDDEEEDKYE